MMSHRQAAWAAQVGLAGLFGCSAAATTPVADGADAKAEPSLLVESPEVILGRYRGFNLQGMYKLEWNKGSGYAEKDFEILHELGFNYARLPLDYMAYTRRGDWLEYLPEKLHLIDQAVRWGQQYGVHVALNLHQAPGYCVHDPASLDIPEHQRLDLWKDTDAQAAFVAHWRMFAERYAQVPPEYLSFNLLNEPNDSVDEPTYLAVMEQAMAAIRSVDQRRVIELDGINGSRDVIGKYSANPKQYPTLRQSLHAYEPHGLTHYGASWVAGASDWPTPEWPPNQLVKYLYGALKKADGLQSTLVIEGDFPQGTEVTVEVGQVSQGAHFVVQADTAPVLEQEFKPGAGDGEWKTVVFDKRWNIYQNIYNREYVGKTPRAAKQISFEVKDGDWLTINEIKINLGSKRVELTPGITSWGVPQAKYRLTDRGKLEPIALPQGFARHFQPLGYLEPWKKLEADGGQVIVGEFGVYKSVPHATTLVFLEALLKELQAANLGWALWDFNGAFGPFDSERSDVQYEAYEGYELDRKMMDLLQAH